MAAFFNRVTDSPNDRVYEEKSSSMKEDSSWEERMAVINEGFEALRQESFEKTWSEKVADTIRNIAETRHVEFSFASIGDRDIFTLGNEQAVITKRLVGGSVGLADGIIRVFIKRDDYERFAWLRAAIAEHPINFIFDE